MNTMNSMICRKCKVDKPLDQYSNPSKEKRCRQCAKMAKFSENKKPRAIDYAPTDYKNKDWQGGKYSGTVFMRKNNSDYFIACVKGKQKPFRIKDYTSTEDAKQKAIEWQYKTSDEICATKNKYKLIFDQEKPVYIMVQLSKSYVTLVDYDESMLDFIKNNHLVVTCSRDRNIYYAAYGSSKINLLHRYITNCCDSERIIDHIDHYPLDNRKSNLRVVSYKENNNNRSCLIQNSIEEVGNEFKATVSCIQEIQTKMHASKSEAHQWICDTIKTFNEKYAKRHKDSKTLGDKFEDIMNKYSDGFKWRDLCEDECVEKSAIIDSINQKKADDILKKTQNKNLAMYTLFTQDHPDFILDTESLDLSNINHIIYETIEYKFCTTCKKWLTLDCFFKGNKRDGFCSKCKTCNTVHCLVDPQKDINKYTVPELKSKCKSLKIRGYCKLARNELLSLLQKHMNSS